MPETNVTTNNIEKLATLSGDSPIGITTISIQESAFINGRAFTHSDYTLGVLADNVTNYLFDPTACTCDQIVAEVPIFNATSGPVTIEFFAGTIVSANGTELDSFNRRSGGDIPEAKLYIGPTITFDGARFSGIILTATEAAQGDTGAVTVSGLPFEVSKSIKILIRVTNANGVNNIGRRFDWVEA
jgi:hypothetical protein